MRRTSDASPSSSRGKAAVLRSSSSLPFEVIRSIDRRLPSQAQQGDVETPNFVAALMSNNQVLLFCDTSSKLAYLHSKQYSFMRHQGRITDWKDERGFGFITPNGGGASVFVHINGFKLGQQRPVGNELVTYDLAFDPQTGRCAQNVAFAGMGRSPAQARTQRSLKLIGVAGLVGAIAVCGGWYFLMMPDAPALSGEFWSNAAPSLMTDNASNFKCEGKRYCSQVRSCKEATFYLKNCPGTAMDADGDGVPCESHWCPEH